MSRYIDEELVVEALQSCLDTDSIYDENNGIDYISHDDAVKFISEIPTSDVIQISDGATNGDVIKVLFPNIQIREVCNDELIEFTFDGVVGTSVLKKWWNSPYKPTESENK